MAEQVLDERRIDVLRLMVCHFDEAFAAEMICQREVEPNRIGKTVLVIDEAQDMGAEEYALYDIHLAG